MLAAVGASKLLQRFRLAPLAVALPIAVFLLRMVPATSGPQLPKGLESLSTLSQQYLTKNQTLYVVDDYHVSAAYYSDRPTVLVTSDERNFNIPMAVPGLRMSKTVVFVPPEQAVSFWQSLQACDSRIGAPSPQCL